MHGKTSPILHDGRSVFRGLPSPFTATRKLAWAEYRQALRDYPSGWTKAKPWPQPPQE